MTPDPCPAEAEEDAGPPSAALAVIPARGGSKRVPRKNVRRLGGKPLLAYTVTAALASGAFRRVVVSTDDAEVAAAATAAGAEVLARDADLADDHTPSSAVTLDALRALGGADRYPVVAQLLPNCPLRDAADVRASAAAFLASGAPFQVSVAPFGWQVAWWAVRLGEAGAIEPLFPGALAGRSQDLPSLYCPTGAIWWARSAALVSAGTFYGPGVRGEPLPWRHALDIDEPADLELAATLLEAGAAPSGATPPRHDPA